MGHGRITYRPDYPLVCSKEHNYYGRGLAWDQFLSKGVREVYSSTAGLAQQVDTTVYRATLSGSMRLALPWASRRRGPALSSTRNTMDMRGPTLLETAGMAWVHLLLVWYPRM